MSTRVQKGSQKFKPITKPRPRLSETPSRQTSTVPDSNALQYSRSLVEGLQPSFKAPDLSHLQAIAEVPSEVAATVPSRHYEAPDSSVNDGQNTPLTSPGVSGGRYASETDRDNEQYSSLIELVQDELQNRVAQVRSSLPPLVGTSRAIPVIVPSRSLQRPVQRPAAPIILSAQSPGPPATNLTEGMDNNVSQANSASIPVDGATFAPNLAPALCEAPVPLSSAPVTVDETSFKRGRKHRKSRTSSVTPSSNSTGTTIQKQRHTSETRAAGIVDSQHQAGSQQTEQSSRRRTSIKRSTTLESSIAHSDAGREEGYNNDKLDHSTQTRKRRHSATPSSSRGGRRARVPSLPPFDPDADPGEELDPTVTTMATICDDTGQGRVSSKAAVILRNHAAWKTESKAKRARMRALMEAKKYGRKDEEADVQAAEPLEADKVQPPPALNRQPEAEEIIVDSGERPRAGAGGFNYDESVSTNRFNVQVRIGPNGETIIDEESLFVDRTEGEEDVTERYAHVEESDQTKFVNSASYSRKLRGFRWSAEETELFYDALSQFGENYELISYMLPGRDRKACKNKFKAEDRKNPNRITFCLNNRVPYDIQTLSRMTGKDFSGPTPEIRIPDIPAFTHVPDTTTEEPTPGKPAKQVRKKSRTPAGSDGVEILGDVETFNMDLDD